MTLTPLESGHVLEALKACGVSPFNVYVRRSDGLVIFHSNGLSAEEIHRAQFELVKVLISKGRGKFDIKA